MRAELVPRLLYILDAKAKAGPLHRVGRPASSDTVGDGGALSAHLWYGCTQNERAILSLVFAWAF